MTEVYFVRHSKVDYTESDSERKLSDQGILDKSKVNEYFENICVDTAISSPFIRAIDTIRDVAEKQNLDIIIIDELRERKVSDSFIDNFDEFCMNQWYDFDFKLDGGESFNDVRLRGIPAVEKVVQDNDGKIVIIGTHGTFLSIYLNHLDSSFGYEGFKNLRMPDIVKVTFDEGRYIEKIHLEI